MLYSVVYRKRGKMGKCQKCHIMNLNDLLDAICVVNKQEKDRVLGKNRYKELVFTRQLFYYFAKTYYGATLKEIQEVINVHHTTILYSVELINNLIYIEDAIALGRIERIKAYIKEKYHMDKRVNLYIPFEVNHQELCKMLIERFNCRIVEEVIG